MDIHGWVKCNSSREHGKVVPSLRLLYLASLQSEPTNERMQRTRRLTVLRTSCVLCTGISTSNINQTMTASMRIIIHMRQHSSFLFTQTAFPLLHEATDKRHNICFNTVILLRREVSLFYSGGGRGIQSIIRAPRRQTRFSRNFTHPVAMFTVSTSSDRKLRC
jgi:hypothetical protein